MPQVVLENPEMVVRDLGVRRVEVGGVDVASRQRAVGHVVIELPHVGLRKAVATPEPRPAVGPMQEFFAESEPERGVGAQIGDPPHAQPDGVVLSHPQGVAVLESQGTGHPHSLPDERGPQGVVASVSRRTRKDVRADRPGVLRVQVDLPRPQRVPEHLRAAELRAVLGARAGAAHDLRDNLAEHDRLGELL